MSVPSVSTRRIGMARLLASCRARMSWMGLAEDMGASTMVPGTAPPVCPLAHIGSRGDRAQCGAMRNPARLQPLVEDGLIDSVSRQLMSGKEAMVFVVRAG